MPEQTQEQTITDIPVPSRARLLKATLLALILAGLILVTTVLPAEYGIDPLKTGAAIGLTRLSKAQSANLNAATGPYTPQPRTYKVDSEDFRLSPGQGVEMKYHMPKGAVMVYSWKANGVLRYEFHGEPDQKPSKDYYDSYELDRTIGKDQMHGSFTAPSTGIHGWFWENKGDKDVDFHLATAGFYDSAKMFAGGPPEDMPVEDAK